MASQSQLNHQALHALNEAALAISTELAVDKVLQLIVDSARKLVSAQFAALGVPNLLGGLDTFIHSGIGPERVQKMGHLPEGKGLLGVIIKEKRPIRLNNIADDPRSVGFPPHHPPMRSFLGVPIIAGDEVYGNLYLANKLGAASFSRQDQSLVEMLAAHAAIAIQNARLYEQVERLAVLEERNRIGMDLHDGVIQSIYAVGLTLESARYTLPDHMGETDKLLKTAVSQLNLAIQDIRNFIMDLRPRRFQGDLREGLSKLVREFQANTMIQAKATYSGNQLAQLDALSLPTARTLFLTTQEALANIARHAKAGRVTVDVVCENDWIVLRIKDDGIGFDLSDAAQKVGHGLSNMQIRAQERSGTFEINSDPGQGAEIVLKLPAIFVR